MSAAAGQTKKVRVAVVGAGEFGRNHARVYREIADAELIGVYDKNGERSEAIATEFATQAFRGLEELRGRVDAVSVAVPTVEHAAVGCRLMELGLDVLVEKPMATNLAEADALLVGAKRFQRILQVGHVERFNPAVLAVEPILNQPLFFEVHRLGVFTARSLDVDVIYDVMIHDLDILLTLVKESVTEVKAVGIPVLTDKVDIAHARLEFVGGAVANVTASRVSTERVRKLRFFQPRQYISLDYGRQEVLVFTVGQDGKHTGLPSPNPQIGVTKPPVAAEEPLHAELASFLRAVRERSTPEVPFEDGRRALALALEIVSAIRDHGKKIDLAGIAKGHS
jgi:predicted dehydrogenase